MRNRACFFPIPFFLLAFLLFPTTAFAQLSLTTSGTTVTIDFDSTISGVNNGAFAGSGFQPSPGTGQLNSNAWAMTGWSDGTLAFGGTRNSDDFARGNTTLRVTNGGVYSHDTLSQRRLMIQPASSDWAPGTLTLRIRNNLGVPLRQINIAYDIFIRNDEDRANSFNFSYSTDDAIYTPVASMDYTSPAAGVAGARFQLVDASPSRQIRIAGLDIPNGGFFYVRWSGNDVSGTGARDEFALDNIAVTGFDNNLIAAGSYPNLHIVGDPSGDRPALAGNITPANLLITPAGALDALDNQILGTGSMTIRGRFVTQRQDGLSGVAGAAFPSASFTLDSLSTIRYERGSGTQTVTGRSDYGNLEVAGASTKSINGNTLIRGSLVLVASTLDVGNNTLTFRSGNTPIVRNGVTQTGQLIFGSGATLQFGDAVSQLGNAFTIPANTFPLPPFIQNFTINRTNAITLGNQNIFTNSLTLTNGIVITSSGGSTATGGIIVFSDAPGAITGGSSTSHIRGLLRRFIQANVSSDGVSYFYPVADSLGAYRPATLQNIRTGSGSCAMDVTAGAAGASTFDGTLLSVRSPHWLVQERELPSNFNSATLELTATSLINGENLIGASDDTVSGTYSSIGGTVSGSTITSDPQAFTLKPTNPLRYVAIGAFSAEPTVQASGISFASVTASSFTINFTAGNGTNRLVVMRRQNPVTFTPTDAVNYTGVNSIFSLASNQDADSNRIVFAGTGSSVSVTGLSGNTTYHVAIYEFNGTLSNNSANFLITSPPTGVQTTVPNQPTQNTNQLTFSNFQTNALTLSWNVPSGDVGANRVVVVRADIAPVAPSDFKAYTANPVFGSGDTTGAGTGFVVYNGNAPNTVTVTGLSPEKQYFFSIFEYNGSGTTSNYNPSGASANRFTLKAEPTASISGLSASPVSKTSIKLDWSPLPPPLDSILIVARIGGGGFASGFPQDGIGYSIGQFINFTDRIRVVGRVAGAVNTFTVSGLASSSPYSFLVIPFNRDVASTQTANYFFAGRAEIDANTSPGIVYRWKVGNGSWSDTAKWNPADTPTVGDKALFDGIGAITVSNVPTTSIGAIEIRGNTSVTLTASTGATTVSLTGFGSGSGNALSLNSGADSLTLSGSPAITLAIQSGNTGRVGGVMRFTGDSHRLTSPDSASVIFENGSQMIAATGFTGNAFGNTNLNSVIFQNGSTYRAQAGANPFGATQPNSVVIFQSGSTYSQEVNTAPATSGRTYANFAVNLDAFSQPLGGAAAFTVDSLLVNSASSVTINGTGGFVVRGNIFANAGTTTIGSTTTPVTFSGASQQKIRGSGGTLTFGPNAAVTLNNPNGLRLERNIQLNGALTLTNGILDAGTSELQLSASATVAGGSDSSYVVGTVSRVFNTTATARLYPFGSFGRYRPISILGNTSVGTGTLRGRLFDLDANLREEINDPPNRVSTVRYYGFQATGNSITVDQIPVLRANVDDGVGTFLSNTSLRIATARSGTGWTLRSLASAPNTTSLPLDLSSETGLGFAVNVAPDSVLFALGSTSNTDNPLPVELLAYTGESTGDGAVLNWNTASEIDNLGFTILKDGVEVASFANTPSLRGRGTTSEETRYQFVDSKVKVGEVHQYNLRQTDLNGAVHDLGTVTLNITTAVAPREYSLSQNYPNPFNPTTTITYALKASGEVKLELFDVLGRKVATLVNARQDAGSYTLPLNAARYGLSTGMYFYRLQSGGFIATKKMLLVK